MEYGFEISFAVTSAQLWRWAGIAVFLALLGYWWHCIHYDAHMIPKGLNWGGFKPGAWFTIPRAHLSDWWSSRECVSDGYQKYSKKGKPYLTGNRNWDLQVVLPPSQIKWLMDFPETVIATYKILLMDIAFLFAYPKSTNLEHPFQLEAIKKMNWVTVTDDMVDEIDATTKLHLGTKPGEEKKWDLNMTMRTMVAHVTSRVFMGKEIAHDRDYLYFTNALIGEFLPLSLLVKTFLPYYFWFAVWPFFAIPVRYYEWKCRRSLKPILQRYIAEAYLQKAGGKDIINPTIVQTIAKHAVESPDPVDRTIAKLTSVVLAMNVYDAIGTHTINIVAINAWSNILLAGPTLLEALRKEAASVLAEFDGKWTKAAVNKLVLMDSTLRESLRFSGFKARGVERQVVAKEGVTTPDGTFLPYSTPIGLPSTDVHADKDVYQRPDEFCADRFVSKREGNEMTKVSTTFMAFGLGKHACPGRFFAAHEMKLLFAHMILTYDFEKLDEHPGHIIASDFLLPKSVTVTCRRREEPEKK